MKRISDIPSEDRPREKLLKRGAESLSDVELLAILLGTGSKTHPVMKVAAKIQDCMDANQNRPTLEQLQKLPGVGPVRAMLVTAAMEFARRRIRPTGVKIRVPKDILPLIQHYADRKQEHFLCTSLNGANEVINTRVVTVGLVNGAQVHPREVFADPLSDRASSVILAHNHPSGSLNPSVQDKRVTRRLVEAGKILGIRVIDHVIIAHNGYYSFAESGIMPGT